MGKISFKEMFGATTRKGAEFEVEDPSFQEQFPYLYQLMALTKDDDGKPRQTCTLMLVCEGGVVKAGLRERNHGLSLWVSSQSLGGVFTALEEAIQQVPPQWRKIPEKYRSK